MAININQQGSYTLKKGELFFGEGHNVNSLNILLQGKVDVLISSASKTVSSSKNIDAFQKTFRIFNLDKSMFIGANNILTDQKYNCSYQAAEDSAIYIYPHQSLPQTWALINSQKDYGSFIINSLYTMINGACSALKKLKEISYNLKVRSENLAAFFWVLKEFYQLEYTPSQKIFLDGLNRLKLLQQNGMQPVPFFSREFIEQSILNENDTDDICSSASMKSKIEYFEHLYNLPIDLKKSFFGADMYITSFHCNEEAECYNIIINKLRETFVETESRFESLYSEKQESIYSVFVKVIKELASEGKDSNPALQALEYSVNQTSELVNFYTQEYNHKCETDLEYIDHSFNTLSTTLQSCISLAGASASIKLSNDYNSLPDELKDSASKILEFSELPKQQTDAFLLNLLAFRNMKDRLSTEENARNIRSNASACFFDIYEAVFKKAYKTNDTSRLINMFLNFAYMDEKMLETDQVMTLYKLAGKDPAIKCESINPMRDWLSKIYSSQKDPSINEFGQDYFDIFREMKRRSQVTDKDKNSYDSSNDGRLSFEIGNMLKTNQKLCHGQISTYFPVLHKEILTKDLQKAQITPAKVRQSIDKIIDTDFSAFYREIHYIDQKKSIEKELIMKAIEPDIILIPIYGSRSMMWQEISGRNRSTPGRFLLPAFTDEDLDSMLLKLVGNFRWELCRTMMGAAWNDVSESSLTSDYSDYLQFYKKNKDLSEEAKDKIKAQSVKYHNKTRDIFTSDYEIWVNHESKGNVRLNKVARAIFYKYCPLNKTIRENLEKQPMFTEMAMQYKNLRLKTARELENRYSKYIKNSGELDANLEHNLKFYRDM